MSPIRNTLTLFLSRMRRLSLVCSLQSVVSSSWSCKRYFLPVRVYAISMVFTS